MLRRYIEARNAGDLAAARRWWDEVLRVNHHRIKQMVFLESRGRLAPHEQDEAVQRAAIAMARKPFLAETPFRGTTMGEWVTLAKFVVRGACVDTQRAEMVHSRRRAPLETTRDDGEERHTAEVYEAIMKEAREREQAREDEQELLAFGRQFLDWALPQLSGDQRAIIECDLEGLPTKEIMRRLNRGRDAVYKLRERAMTRLRQLREEYEA